MGQEINSALTGLADSLSKYMGLGIQNKMEQATEQRKAATELESGKQLAQYKSGLDLSNDQAKELYKQTIQGVIDPETAAAISPVHAEVIKKYMAANGGHYPPTPVADKLFDDIKTQGDKQQKSDDVRISQWGKQLSSDREFTLLRTKRDNLENVGALLEQVATQPDGPDKRQLYEQSIAQMRVLAGNGQISEKEIEQLLPKSYRGSFAGFLEKITNKPEGTEAQEFIKRSNDFFARESKVTDTQLSRRVNQLADPMVDILSRNPNPAAAVFEGYGVHHPKYNPADPEAAKPAPQSVTPANRPSLDSIFGGK